jgi:cytochrome c oxidase subunit II
MTVDFQSVLQPAGVQSAEMARVWWVLSVTATVILAAVLVALAAALKRRSQMPSDQRLLRVVGAATGLSVLILFALLTTSLVAGRSIASLRDPNPLKLEVTGNQWWWEVRYDDSAPSETFSTANEIHVPVGRTVQIDLQASDVIHSFWVPNLHGKLDAIPGRINTLWLRADEPGAYRGQCAEFCGLQHAHMALWVIAETASEFERWRRGQIAPSVQPVPGSVEEKGKQAFLSLPCGMCHSIRGTVAFGQVAPDLTHIASRRSIAAGTLPNSRGHLGGWITDAQSIKPGTRMPAMNVSAEDLPPLLSYLESLK